MQTLDNNILRGIAFVLVFGLGAAAMKVYDDHRQIASFHDDEIYDEFFNDDFFAHSRSPFQEMHRLQERMDELFDETSAKPSFDRWFGSNFGDSPAQNIVVEENEKSLAYVLEIGDSQVANVDVSTSNGYVLIKAELKQQTESMTSSTSIRQRFPVPANVDSGSVSVEQDGDRVVVKFDKTLI